MFEIPLESAEDLYNFAPCGYFDMTRDRKIVRINDTLLGWLGYSREEVLGRASFNDWLNTGTRLYIETHFVPTLHTQGFVSDTAFVVKRKDGNEMYVLINSKFVQVNENLTIIRSTVFDASHRRSFEKELLYSKRQSDTLTKELQLANDELRKFAYAASHDLKAPLTNIVSLLDLIKSRLSESEQGQLLPLIDMAGSAASRMSVLIQDLLEHAVHGNTGSTQVVFSWKEAMEEVMFNLNQLILVHRAKIVFDGRITTIKGVQTDIVRLFQNLISNAIKYTAKDIRPVVIVRSKDQGDHWEFIIEDNGIGIDPQYQEQIFKPFVRLHSVKEYDGSGIGLATCRNIVEQHKGSISLESEASKGSRFIVKLPK